MTVTREEAGNWVKYSYSTFENKKIMVRIDKETCNLLIWRYRGIQNTNLSLKPYHHWIYPT